MPNTSQTVSGGHRVLIVVPLTRFLASRIAQKRAGARPSLIVGNGTEAGVQRSEGHGCQREKGRHEQQMRKIGSLLQSFKKQSFLCNKRKKPDTLKTQKPKT